MAKYLRCIWTEFFFLIVTKNIALHSYIILKYERCATKEEDFTSIESLALFDEKWSGPWIRNCSQNFSCNTSLRDPFSLTTLALSYLFPTLFLSQLNTGVYLLLCIYTTLLYYLHWSLQWISFTWRKINQKSRNRKLSLSRARSWPWVGSPLVWYNSIT